MRTLHVDTGAGWRGGQQQVLYLTRGLVENGHEVTLATPGGGVLAARAGKAGIRVIPWTARGDVDLPAAFRLRGVLGDAEILHLHSGRAHAMGLLATVGLAQRPHVVVTRRVDFPVKGGPAGRWKFGDRVDRFIAISGRVEAVLREGGVPAEAITRVYSGVDPGRFDVAGDPARVREELGIPRRAKLVGCIGALVGHKAPLDLLHAVSELPADAHVVYVGEGPLREDLVRESRNLKVEDRVHLMGHRDDVPRILRSIDVFCLPSRLEGLGTSVLDAMAASLPVVGTRAGGIPEMVEDGRSGLLVAPGTPAELGRALARVLRDGDLAARLARGARRRVEDFTARRMVRGTEAVYRALTG